MLFLLSLLNFLLFVSCFYRHNRLSYIYETSFHHVHFVICLRENTSADEKKIINLQLCKKKKKHQNLYVKKSMIFPADYLQPQLNNGGPLCDDTTAFGRWPEEPGAPQQRPSDCTKSQSIPRGQNISWRSNGRWIWRENRPCYKPKQVENSLFVYTDTYSLWQL